MDSDLASRIHSMDFAHQCWLCVIWELCIAWNRSGLNKNREYDIVVGKN